MATPLDLLKCCYYIFNINCCIQNSGMGEVYSSQQSFWLMFCVKMAVCKLPNVFFPAQLVYYVTHYEPDFVWKSYWVTLWLTAKTLQMLLTCSTYSYEHTPWLMARDRISPLEYYQVLRADRNWLPHVSVMWLICRCASSSVGWLTGSPVTVTFWTFWES